MRKKFSVYQFGRCLTIKQPRSISIHDPKLHGVNWRPQLYVAVFYSHVNFKIFRLLTSNTCLCSRNLYSSNLGFFNSRNPLEYNFLFQNYLSCFITFVSATEMCSLLCVSLCLSKAVCICFSDICIAAMSLATLCNKLFKEMWYSNVIFLYLAVTEPMSSPS